MQIGKVFVGAKGGVAIKNAETERKPSCCFSFCGCEPCRKCGHEEVTRWNCHFCAKCANYLVFKEETQWSQQLLEASLWLQGHARCAQAQVEDVWCSC